MTHIDTLTHTPAATKGIRACVRTFVGAHVRAECSRACGPLCAAMIPEVKGRDGDGAHA